MYAYCLGQLRDRQEADDAVQSTFLYAFQLLQRGELPKRPLPWLYTIAHNVCRTRRRALRRRSRLESGVDLETLEESVGRNDPPRDDLANLATALVALPASQREALVLREWHGLSYDEIALRLGLSQSAVEAVLFRARRNLAQKLRPIADRVASVGGLVLLLPGLRRLSPLADTTKAAATAIAIGAAAATTLVPLGDLPRQVDRTRVTPARTIRASPPNTVQPVRPLPMRVRRVVSTGAPPRVVMESRSSASNSPPAAASRRVDTAETAPVAQAAGPAPQADPPSASGTQPHGNTSAAGAGTPIANLPTPEVLTDDPRTIVADLQDAIPDISDLSAVAQPAQSVAAAVTNAVPAAAPLPLLSPKGTPLHSQP
jgi:RNA polymerase sigma factor (sigma-70 family)